MLSHRFVTLVALLALALSACGSNATPGVSTPVATTRPSTATTAASTQPAATSVPSATPVAPTATALPPTPTVAPTARPTSPPTRQPTTAAPTSFNPTTTTIRLEPVASGLRIPTDVVSAKDGSGRLFVSEKAGTIRIVSNGQVQPTPFLDITPIVRANESERGLLGLAFHPKYKENGFFFVYYTAANPIGDLVIARYKVSADPNAADPNSATELLRVKHDQASNHNGGNLMFGPDGYLYIGMGDGGGGGDTFGNSQNPNALLAKLLRIDVNNGTPYGIPKDNPFVNKQGFRPEIWAWGLRNPWRFSFDRATGDLYIADVGQNIYEEVDFQPASSKGGENYGWNKWEGMHCYPESAQCDPTGFVMPIGEYAHRSGDCSITGGYVYRGKEQPALTDAYIFADYCTGHFRALSRDASGAWRLTDLINAQTPISSFGEDEQGEIYALGYGDGMLYRVAAAQK